MPKLINKNEKKILIMKAAISEFARSGYEKASMNAIARQINLGRTAFYSYFSDKQELLDYALDYLLDLIGADYLIACDRVFLTSIEKISYLMRRFVTDLITEKEIISVLLEVMHVNNPEFRSRKQKVFSRLAEIKELFAKILKLGIKTGEVRKLAVDSTAHMLLMMLISTLYSINTFPAESVKKTIEACNLLLTGLQARKTEQGDQHEFYSVS